MPQGIERKAVLPLGGWIAAGIGDDGVRDLVQCQDDDDGEEGREQLSEVIHNLSIIIQDSRQNCKEMSALRAISNGTITQFSSKYKDCIFCKYKSADSAADIGMFTSDGQG